MPAVLKTPRRIEPAAFYNDYLPSFWTTLSEDSQWPAWDFCVRFDIDGEIYDVVFVNGKLSTAARDSLEPLVAITCTGDHWRLMVHDTLPRILRYIDGRLRQTPRLIVDFAAERAPQLDPQQLLDLPGLLEISFTDDAGDKVEFSCRIGTGIGPRAALEASDSDLWAVLKAGSGVVDLIKSRARVSGDVAWVWRLLRLEG